MSRAWALVLFCSACSGAAAPLLGSAPRDAGQDGSDAGPDVEQVDAGADGPLDAPLEAAPDSAPDALPPPPFDAAPDVAPDVCVAQPCDNGENCGDKIDTCGNRYNCGTCTGTNVCGGSGRSNVCGCSSLLCPSRNPCGTICGGTVSCGTCTGHNQCGVVTPNECDGFWAACKSAWSGTYNQCVTLNDSRSQVYFCQQQQIDTSYCTWTPGSLACAGGGWVCTWP